MQGGITALAWASIQGHETVVEMLLKAGAKPNIQDQVSAHAGKPRY